MSSAVGGRPCSRRSTSSAASRCTSGWWARNPATHASSMADLHHPLNLCQPGLTPQEGSRAECAITAADTKGPPYKSGYERQNVHPSGCMFGIVQQVLRTAAVLHKTCHAAIESSGSNDRMGAKEVLKHEG